MGNYCCASEMDTRPDIQPMSNVTHKGNDGEAIDVSQKLQNSLNALGLSSLESYKVEQNKDAINEAKAE